MDAFGRVWDLRTGRCIMFMEGHLKTISSIAISPNGYQVVTGSADHSIKVWNLRTRSCEYTIPAHNNIVSKVMFEKHSGAFLVSSSYDNSVKTWAHPSWTPIQTLQGHDNKVMCVDSTPDSSCFVTASFDRTFKIWTPQSIGQWSVLSNFLLYVKINGDQRNQWGTHEASMGFIKLPESHVCHGSLVGLIPS